MNIPIEMAVQSSAIILLLMMARSWIKKALNARTVYALWLIPLIRLTVPFSVYNPYSLWRYVIPTQAATLHTGESAALAPSAAVKAVTLTGRVSEAASSPLAEVLPQAADSFRWDAFLAQALPILWASGALAVLILLVMSNRRFVRSVGKPKLLTCKDSPLPIYVVNALPSPCLTGVFRPRILLSPAAIRTEKMLDMVLLHELTHWRRGDHVWTMLRALMLCLWWWNPLVWLAAKSSREDCELACDEAAVRGMDALQREVYGISLIELMRNDSAKTFPLRMGTAMSTGRKQMEERIKMIIKKRKRFGPAALCMLLGIALILPLVFTRPAVAAPVASRNVGAPDLPAYPEANVPLSEKEEIELAKLWVLGHLVHDDGYGHFADESNVSPSILSWDGEPVPVDIVKLRAVTNRGDEYLIEVYIHRDLGRVLRIAQEGMIYWDDPEFKATPAENLNRKAYVSHPGDPAVSMLRTDYPGDYGFAKEQLFNGTEVIINQILEPRKGVSDAHPEELRGQWAAITVAQTERFAGSKGYVPLNFLSDEANRETLIEGVVYSEDGGAVSLLADTGLTENSLVSCPVGTRVRVLGQTMSYYHVRAQGFIGFLPLSALQFDRLTGRALADAQPSHAYEELQPGWEQLRAAYEFKLHQLYNRYGDPNRWTLEQSAQGSALALTYGFTWQNDKVHILPGPDTLTENEAVEKGKVYAEKEFGIKTEQVSDIWTSYFYPPLVPDERMWLIRFSVKGPGYDCAVYLDDRGELIKTWKSPVPNPSAEETGRHELTPDDIRYYLEDQVAAEPLEGDLNEESALRQAAIIFNREYPESLKRSYDSAAVFYQDKPRNLRWWQVEFVDWDEIYRNFAYTVILLAPDGSRNYHQTEGYRDLVIWADRLAKAKDLEKTWGPFMTWTVAQKAEFDPDAFTLPADKDITQKEAVEKAILYLKENHGLSDGVVAAFTVGCSFDVSGRWRVDFMSKETLRGEDGTSYTVIMDGKTGGLVDILWSLDPDGNG